MKAALIGIAVVSLTVACNPIAPAVPRYVINGTFTLVDSTSIAKNGPFAIDATSCRGAGGYSDIAEGTGVVVKDGDGTTIGATTLSAGMRSDTSTGFGLFTFRCVFKFKLVDVPEVPFYALEVARRGAITHSLGDLKGRSWTISLTLGG